MCAENPQQWYKHVDKVQQCINNTPPRSTKFSPFRILTGSEMRIDSQNDIRKLIDEYAIKELDEQRDEIREKARSNIAEIQAENKKSSNKKRVEAPIYRENELVAIKRTQFGPGLKLKSKYLGPYKVIRSLKHDRYEVEKLGEGEGPKRTNTVAEYMKKWNPSFGTNDRAGWPNVGLGINGRSTRSGRTY